MSDSDDYVSVPGRLVCNLWMLTEDRYAALLAAEARLAAVKQERNHYRRLRIRARATLLAAEARLAVMADGLRAIAGRNCPNGCDRIAAAALDGAVRAEEA